MATRLAKRSSDGRNWTDKERMFTAEYLVDFNGKRAAIAAGYAAKTAAVMACKLLKKPKIAVVVGKAQNQLIQQKGLEREEVLKKVAENLHRDLHQLVDSDGFFISDLRKLPREISSFVDGFKVRQMFGRDGEVVGQTIEIKLSSCTAIQDIAMKHVGGYAIERHETTHNLNWEDLYKASDESDPIEAKLQSMEKEK